MFNCRSRFGQSIREVQNLAVFQPRSQGLSSQRPREAEKRDPGNEVGSLYQKLFV